MCWARLGGAGPLSAAMPLAVWLLIPTANALLSGKGEESSSEPLCVALLVRAVELGAAQNPFAWHCWSGLSAMELLP